MIKAWLVGSLISGIIAVLAPTISKTPGSFTEISIFLLLLPVTLAISLTGSVFALMWSISPFLIFSIPVIFFARYFLALEKYKSAAILFFYGVLVAFFMENSQSYFWEDETGRYAPIYGFFLGFFISKIGESS